MSAQPIHAIAFDFDGTLADTHPAITATVEQTLQQLRVPQLAHATVVGLIGLPLVEVFRTAGIPSERLDAAIALYREIFPRNLDRVALFEGADDCLSALCDAPIALGVTSSRGRGSLLPLIDRFKLGARFRVVLGDEDVARKKPAPDFVHALCDRLGVPSSRVLVVGDTTYDIEMGSAAGALTCGISHGGHDHATLSRANPTWIVDSFAALSALLREQGVFAKKTGL